MIPSRHYVPMHVRLEPLLEAVVKERERQDDMWGPVVLRDQTQDRRLVILTEEIGEVAKAILERDWSNLRTELIQVAAVALANAELLEHQLISTP